MIFCFHFQALEFTENVFMYDEDQLSSFVTSSVLQIDVRTPDMRVTPGYMTFDQTVTTPTAQTIKPEVDEEDASEFSYHIFIYQSSIDHVCMVLAPEDDVTITFYTIYIRFTQAPSILDYDFTMLVTKENNWELCILPEFMRGHTGLTYMGIKLQGAGK